LISFNPFIAFLILHISSGSIPGVPFGNNSVLALEPFGGIMYTSFPSRGVPQKAFEMSQWVSFHSGVQHVANINLIVVVSVGVGEYVSP
jgi:hypothetical protein